MSAANSISILKGWGGYAAAVIVRLKVLAPYALIELVLPGGSVMALLLWLYRRRKHGVGFGQLMDSRSESAAVAHFIMPGRSLIDRLKRNLLFG
jgi:hypothetical protein